PLNEEMPRSPAEELMLHFLHREAQKGRMPYLGSFTSDGKALVKRMGKKYNRHGLSIGENPNYEPHRTLQFNPVDAHPIALVAKADWRSE
ncbi:MAG: hypothetical protein Q8P02_01540, partial [Candidatus Micrarchaeota archaeon]|nr:hypothetical protein [Candidatus Micrarchaeota archaeon]